MRRLRRAASAAFVALCACGGPSDPAELERQAGDCPEVSGVPVAGVPPRAMLLDAYYLQEETARALRRGEATAPELEETLAKARALGAFAVRTWAFNDDPARAGDSALQVAPLTYDEVSFRGLDTVLARAAASGLKLVLPLGNAWDDYGGARQYAAWAGLPSPVEADPRFFTDRAVIDHYKAHVARVLDRVSAVDGIRYGDHPAVLAWELLNEAQGRGLDDSGQQLRAWVDELAAWVRPRAPGHLISTGEDGFDGGGSSFALNASAPGISLASLHWFPETWGYPPDEIASAGARWISERAAVAAAAGKPLMLGELGLRNREGAFNLAERRAMYRGWLRCAWRSGVALAGPWTFAYDARPDVWDLHTWYFLDGSEPRDPRNRYADIFASAGL